MYKTIDRCRICGNERLSRVIDLGTQKLTGVFPDLGGVVPETPVELVKCNGEKCCGLVQLRHSSEPDQMYGMNYGYRSGLNSSMVEHLSYITDYIKELIDIKSGDAIVDIGSNDGTLLGTYGYDKESGIRLIGMDPTAKKFRKYYKDHIDVVEDFFSASNFKAICSEKAKVITSIAMFYDLESPIDFARQIAESLADDGIWVFEQSYMPYMIQTNSFDTICQEHLEYYSMKQIMWILKAADMKAIDVSFNDVNGGSFRVTAAKKDSSYTEHASIQQTCFNEDICGYNNFEIFDDFRIRIEECRKEIKTFLANCKDEGKLVIGYGASTKGNVLLQYFGITTEEIPYIAEVNPDKYGKVTPGTEIPIISEEEAKAMKPDYMFVLPWHFKNNILHKEERYIKESGCKFVFPLPRLNIAD